MRVLYYTRDYSPHDERFLTALAKTSHEVLLLRAVPLSTPKLPGNIRDLSQPYNGRQPSLLQRFRTFRHTIDACNPDLVHAGPLNGPAYIAALGGFQPLVSMSWGYDLLMDANRLVDRTLIKHTLRRSTVLVGDCRAIANKALSFGYPADRIHLFPWGVNLAHFCPQGRNLTRQRLGWQGNFVFLCNRSMEPKYGVDIVVQAFLQAVKTNPNLRLVLFGKGSQEDSLRLMVKDAGQDNKVCFGGFVSLKDLPDSYRSADVFITASHCDGSSVSLMEALACGLPVIASDIPANLEWINPGKNGWTFHDGQADELTHRMLSAADSTDLATLAANARSLAEQKADWSRNFPVLLEAYEHALELNRSGRSRP